ncbi:hypothetical protein ABZZ36_23550 [Actinacidiphila glaucinigra]|uniref:hypothetical protein n=1 Tax=Actinacidiphila glaucinigra TaxID=235986 RepID=UPI0033BEE562
MNRRDVVAPISDLLEERRRLLDLARGLLPSGTEAEEAVEETYRRWYAVGDRDPADPQRWLAETLENVCRSSPGRTRGTAVRGEGTHGDQARGGGARSEAAAEPARQSPRRFRAGRVGAERHREVVRAFRDACASHDLRLLADLLASDVSAVFDGGGRIRTPGLPVGGARKVTRCIGALLAPGAGAVIAEDTFNGRAGLVVRCGRQVAAAISLDVHGDRVVNVWLVLNPDKLRRWNQG